MLIPRRHDYFCGNFEKERVYLYLFIAQPNPPYTLTPLQKKKKKLTRKNK